MSVAVPTRVQPSHASHPVRTMPANARTVASRPVASKPVASKPVAAKPAPRPAPSTSASSSRSATSPTTPTAGPSTRALAPPPAAGKDLSSSTGRIFAKPSKEWVLPERAKPGRKAATDEPENRRQSQNRLSQRAHRARRTDYIQTLEERLRKYEADEIHSNVRLQEVARALKQDNERMKNEVTALQAVVAAAQGDKDAWAAERKTMADSIRSLQRQLEANISASVDRSPHEYEYRPSPVLTPALTPGGAGATPRSVATPRAALAPAMGINNTLACPICPDPDPDCPCQRPMESGPTLGPPRIEPTLGMGTFGRCGLCDLALDACICHRDEVDIKPDIPSSPAAMDASDCGLCTSESFCACRAAAEANSNNFSASFSLSLNIPSSPPAKAAALPLRKKPSASATVAAPAVALKLRRRPAAKQSVWSLDNVPAGTSRAEAVCTGDPKNCDACRDDSFGREFCENLFGKPHDKCNAACGPGGCKSGSGSSTSSASVSISDLVNPTTPVQQPLVLACCGAPELCGHAGGCAGQVLIGPNTLSPPDDERETTMRPEEAWRALKAHPNSKYTPLAILADVVARRSKVLGPRVELSPEPEDRGAGQAGQKRRLAVETSAVRDALKYLDTHDERSAKRARLG